MKKITCPRCSGHGKIEKYNHVESGICFQCNGSGWIEVEDHVKDIIAEIKEQRKQSSMVEKEFNNLWEQYKDEIKTTKSWHNYILCEGTTEATKQEERLIRIKQYLKYKKEWKDYIKNNPNLIEKDIEDIEDIRKEIENKYLYSRE